MNGNPSVPQKHHLQMLHILVSSILMLCVVSVANIYVVTFTSNEHLLKKYNILCKKDMFIDRVCRLYNSVISYEHLEQID